MIGQRKNTAADIVVVGFALFSMFFGAGNVIFPPFLGMEAGSQWLTGFSAYFIADIGLAMMGMFALLRVGSSEKVLERAGKVPAEILMCAIILCVGPMVAIPRTSASTYETVSYTHLLPTKHHTPRRKRRGVWCFVSLSLIHILPLCSKAAAHI